MFTVDFIVCIYTCFSCFYFSIILSFKYEEFVVAIQQIEVLVEGIQPLLAEVRDSTLLKDVEGLLKSLAMATEDLR